MLTGCIKRDTVDTSADLATLKKSFNATGTFTIPEEVYKKIAETLNANSEIKSIYTKYSKNEGKLIKQVAEQIGTLLKKMNDINVPVDEDGATVNYKVSFNGSGIGASESFISVSKGTETAWLNLKGNTPDSVTKALAQYCVSVYNLGKSVTDAKKIILGTLAENGAKILSAVLDNGTESVYKTIFGNSAFETVAKEYTLSQIGELVQSVTNKNISEAVTQYKNLNNACNNLAKAATADNVSDVKSWANVFTNTAKIIQGKLSSLGVNVNLETLPLLALDFVYNADNTAVTIPANCTSEIKSSR